jgi:flavin reductase (DIM6/NTAB) family NADH-FMN oxidoreductase RutF
MNTDGDIRTKKPFDFLYLNAAKPDIMISYEALFNISYGLYIVTSGNKEDANGYISNTVFQVTSEPPKFASCCNKDNYTAEYIKKYGYFAVCVLHNEVEPGIFGRFGFRSGRDFDKMEGLNIEYGETGAPIVHDGAMAYLEIKVVDTVDVGTHLLFIGELVSSHVFDEGRTPFTYEEYRRVRKGLAPKNAPTYIDKSKLDQD